MPSEVQKNITSIIQNIQFLIITHSVAHVLFASTHNQSTTDHLVDLRTPTTCAQITTSSTCAWA